MSEEIVFQDRNPDGITMENIINVADCCRACLRIDCSLTPTSAQDSDSIKFCDKLLSCVSEVVSQINSLYRLLTVLFHSDVAERRFTVINLFNLY